MDAIDFLTLGVGAGCLAYGLGVSKKTLRGIAIGGSIGLTLAWTVYKLPVWLS
jgi:hypothetical protein